MVQTAQPKVTRFGQKCAFLLVDEENRGVIIMLRLVAKVRLVEKVV